MNAISKCTMTLVILSGAAYGQESPNVVASDACEDTAMGTDALGTFSGCTSQGLYNTAVGALVMENATSAAYNNTAIGGQALLYNVSGSGNTAVGVAALTQNLQSNNTAVGGFALYENQNGSGLTAVGAAAMEGAYQGASGSNNTAIGFSALYSYSTGANNTASGFEAMYSDTTGNDNSAFGLEALLSNVAASNNTAVGFGALYMNDTSGSGAAINNTAIGSQAMYLNTEGYSNTAFGYQVLYSNTTGDGNAAQGAFALEHNKTGNQNTALGNHALQSNNGSQNTVLGFEAGYILTGGSNNIDIGSPGGTPTESNTIRIGTTAATASGTALTPQTTAYIAGVAGVNLTGSAVYITSSGQLVAPGSSERFKTDIATMPSVSSKLGQLRPVSFKYKSDASGTTQYGLIAEEVDKVYPELVIRDDTGTIQGVHYEELAPILLSEVQQQRQELSDARALIAAQDAKLASLETLVRDMQQQVARLNAQSKEPQLAMR
jgi:trimeric autotransporter adhesin